MYLLLYIYILVFNKVNQHETSRDFILIEEKKTFYQKTLRKL